MAAIGSLVFCTACGNLLDSNTGAQKKTLICDVCHEENRDTSSKTIVTRSKPSAFPSELRTKRSSVQQLSEEDLVEGASIDETCPVCERKTVRYTEKQLRGADEGSTIFYKCDCGHSWSTNN